MSSWRIACRGLASYAPRSSNVRKPVFQDRFALEELKSLTLYSVHSNQHVSNASIRVIGPRASMAYRSLTGKMEVDASTPSIMPVANGFAAYFGKSTGYLAEDSLEIFSSTPQLVSEALQDLGSDFRRVESDDITKRLFQNGGLRVGDFREVQQAVTAESEVSRRQYLRESGVGLNVLYRAWKDELEYCIMLLQAENQDPKTKDQVMALVKSRLEKLKSSFAHHLSDSRRPQENQRNCQLTIFGPPNSGKSSFINLLAQNNVSEVSSSKGSTKSVIDHNLCISSMPIEITDTVGLDANAHSVISDGFKATIRRIDSCDLKLCILDMEKIYHDKTPAAISPAILDIIDSDTIVVINKSDLVDIRVPEGPSKIRFKNTPLSPQGDVQRHAMRGRVPLRLDGDTTGNTVKYGDYGLRVLEDVRLTEACLQECRSTLHRNIKSVRGARFWLRVKPDHPTSKKAIATRMGKGKAPFDHWEAKVPNKVIVFEIGGGVREDMARRVMKSVAARLPGKTEFVVAPKEETINEMADRIRECSKIPPMGIYAVSCTTGKGIEALLGDLSKILAKKYGVSDEPRSEAAVDASLKFKVLEDCKANLSLDNSLSQVAHQLSSIIDETPVQEAIKYLYHSKHGILHQNRLHVMKH